MTGLAVREVAAKTRALRGDVAGLRAGINLCQIWHKFRHQIRSPALPCGNSAKSCGFSFPGRPRRSPLRSSIARPIATRSETVTGLAASFGGFDQLGRTGFHDGLGLAVGLVIAKTGSLSGESPSFASERSFRKILRKLASHLVLVRPLPPGQPFLDRLADRDPLANRERLGRFVLVAFGDQRTCVVEINDGRGDRSRLRAGINLCQIWHKFRHQIRSPAQP